MQFKHFVGIEKLVVMIMSILLIVSILVSQVLERQRLQTYTSFDSTRQKKMKFIFFFVSTVYAGKITSFL